MKSPAENLNLAASRTVPANELENIDGANCGDPVIWYTGFMPHDPDTEVAELWHSTGLRLQVNPGADAPTTDPSEPEPARCGGLIVTVDLNSGDAPTDLDDVILNTPESDAIAVLGGSDVICGGGGDDKLRGGDGDDLLLGGPGSDDLIGGRGDDEVRCDDEVDCEELAAIP